MKLLSGLLLSIGLLLTACTGTTATLTTTSTPPPTEAAILTSATTTAAPMATLESATPTASPPPRNPATLSPATRPPATETPTAGIPPLPIPLPATSTPTVELGKLPPPPGNPTTAATPPTESTAPAEWATYENDTYGFRFSYPAERWTPLGQLDEPHGLALIYHEQAIVLRMRFSGADEDVDLQLYGGAAGELVTQGSVHFLGEDVERTPLVLRDLVSRVFYNDTEPIARGDMLFSFALVSNRDGLRASLPEDVQAEADGIIESFVLEN